MKKTFSFLTVLAILLLSFGLLAGGCGNNGDEDTTSTPQTEEPEDTATYCPLDHEELASVPERLFAVSIDNGSNSEPQTGLNLADVVYELPVEGGITRFLAVFYHNQPENIGPVRSARHYYIDLVQSLHGIYVHCGGSYIAKEELAAGAVDDIDEVGNGSSFRRDKSRKAPTNLYTSWENLNELAQSKDLATADGLEGFEFYSADEAQGLAQGTTTSITIPYTYKEVSYQWDTASGHYLRYSRGEQHMDATDDTQIYADNVVVIQNRATIIDPNGGLLDMAFIDSSAGGFLFQKGNVIPITWSMAGEGSPLILTKEDGTPAQLVPGKTFFQVITDDIIVGYNDTSSEETAQ